MAAVRPMMLRPYEADVLLDARRDELHYVGCPNAPADAVRWARGVTYVVDPTLQVARCCVARTELVLTR